MAGEGFEIHVTFPQDTTVEFSCEMGMLDGSPFPWADYDLSYRIGDRGRASASLVTNDGLTVDTDSDLLTVTMAPGRLCVGRHSHVCLATETATDKTVALFGGSITIVGDDL